MRRRSPAAPPSLSFRSPRPRRARAVAAASQAHAALVVRAATRASLPVALLSAWRGARRLGSRRWIPAGGAHPRAVVGHLLATLELTRQDRKSVVEGKSAGSVGRRE